MSEILDGLYSVVYRSGEYRTIRLHTPEADKPLAGKRILSFQQGDDWVGFGFLVNDTPNGKPAVAFWRKFRAENPPERLRRIEFAVRTIIENPAKAGLAYALRENRCCRCGLELTVPASGAVGMGPDCARKRGCTKEDKMKAFEWAKSQVPDVTVQGEMTYAPVEEPA